MVMVSSSPGWFRLLLFEFARTTGMVMTMGVTVRMVFMSRYQRFKFRLEFGVFGVYQPSRVLLLLRVGRRRSVVMERRGRRGRRTTDRWIFGHRSGGRTLDHTTRNSRTRGSGTSSTLLLLCFGMSHRFGTTHSTCTADRTTNRTVIVSLLAIVVRMGLGAQLAQEAREGHGCC